MDLKSIISNDLPLRSLFFVWLSQLLKFCATFFISAVVFFSSSISVQYFFYDIYIFVELLVLFKYYFLDVIELFT